MADIVVQMKGPVGPNLGPPKGPPASFPELFEDYSGRAFSGEAGALAVNDDWALTVYDYVPQFAPTIPTLPTPTGDPAKPGASGVNPNAADEYLVIDRAGLATALNNATYQYVFIAKGSDCTNGGHNDNMALTTSGADGAERYFIYWDDVTPSNVEDIKPWNQAQVDRVNMPRIVHNNADYNWFVGLSWGIIETQRMQCCSLTNGSSNNLYYRCNMEYSGNGCWQTTGTTSNNNTAFQCVNHDHTFGTGDIHCFRIQGGDNNKVVSCEGWDFLGDFFHQENNGGNGNICEDCDIYRKTFYDGAGNIDANGEFGAGEGAVDLKNLNPALTDTCKIYGNRIWAMRRLDLVKHPGGGGGPPITFSNVNQNHNLLDCRWNVCFDCADGGIRLAGPRVGETTGGKNSVVRNILYDIRTTGFTAVYYLSDFDNEMYLNTAVDTLGGGVSRLLTYFRNDAQDIDLHDCMGNLFVDTGAINSQAIWGTNFKFGYNAWGATYTKATAGYATDYEDSSAVTNGSPWFMGDFTFIRKKMTGPENYTIPAIVPTTSTPAGFRTLVPTSGGDQIGSRAGIGVDDTF